MGTATTQLAQVLMAAFLAVLFLQSGLDKVLDWGGNRAYIGGYLEKTPLRRFSFLALLAVTGLEVAAGVCSAAGCMAVLFTDQTGLALAGAVLAAVNMLALFLGQRLAKDYASAAAIVPYFLATVFAVLLDGAHP